MPRDREAGETERLCPRCGGEALPGWLHGYVRVTVSKIQEMGWPPLIRIPVDAWVCSECGFVDLYADPTVVGEKLKQ